MREGAKIGNAQTLRRRSTDAEQALWRRLRGRQLASAKFRRQHALGPYVVDFVCLELVIEIDGGQHAAQAMADQRRTADLAELGFRVLRFWNNEVLSNVDGVLMTIERALASPHPSPLPQAGEGDCHGASDPLARLREREGPAA